MNAQRPVMFDGADYDLSQVGRIWRGGRQSAPWSGHAWAEARARLIAWQWDNFHLAEARGKQTVGQPMGRDWIWRGQQQAGGVGAKQRQRICSVNSAASEKRPMTHRLSGENNLPERSICARFGLGSRRRGRLKKQR